MTIQIDLKRSGNVIRNGKEELTGGGLKFSYHNQVIILTSKPSQSQKNELQTEIMLGLGGL